jgi:tripartite-type tricarboxylate transporter receptor subunit TctC
MFFLIRILAVLALTTGAAQTQQYSDKPVRIIFPYSLGSGWAALYQAVAGSMSAFLGQRVLLESKLDANGILGTIGVAWLVSSQ